MQSRQSDRPKSSSKSKFIYQELPSEQLARNAKIINRKQLEKRIQGLKQQQYANICNNLTNQNKRLKQQVKMLKEKVQQLIMTKKLANDIKKNPQVQQQILKQKRQLQIKYQSMNYLKQQIKKRHKQDLFDELTLQQKQKRSQLNVVQKQVIILQKQKKTLQQLLRAHYKDLDQYSFMSHKQTQQSIKTMKKQNSQMKLKLNQMQQNLKQKESHSVAALGKIYDLKKVQQRHYMNMLQSRTMKKSHKTLGQIRQEKTNVTQILQKQINLLKKYKEDTQKSSISIKKILDSKRAKIQKQIEESSEQHKQLLKRKVKLQTQQNYFQIKQKQYQKNLIQKANIKPKQYSQEQIQTQIFYKKQFRKDWIGNITGLTFDDGNCVDYKSEALIKSVTVFYNKDYIVFVKFHYQTPGKRKYQSLVPFSPLILKNCENKKLSSNNNGYLINMKISLTDKKITKIDFKWSDRSILSQGWDFQNSTKYKFDIQEDERPISIFGSVSNQGKNMYALQYLGCQISQIQQ